MKLVYTDQTQSCIFGDSWASVIFDAACLIFFTVGLFACAFISISTIKKADGVGFFAIIVTALLGFEMFFKYAWCTFFFPKRLRLAYLTKSGSLLLKRDVPCRNMEMPPGSELRYGFSQGNFRLDLVQRGNAPHGVNIWFDYQGVQFWVSESSANYRDMLYLLAEHAKLKYDPSFKRMEHIFFLRWRSLWKRPDWNDVMTEIHRILAGEQQRPVDKAFTPSENTPQAMPPNTEPTAESLATREDLQRPVGEKIEAPSIEGHKISHAKIRFEHGKAVIIKDKQ